MGAGANNSTPPPKPTSLGTFLLGGKKVPRRRLQCYDFADIFRNIVILCCRTVQEAGPYTYKLQTTIYLTAGYAAMQTDVIVKFSRICYNAR